MQPSTKRVYFVHERHTHVETIFLAFERTTEIFASQLKARKVETISSKSNFQGTKMD